MVCATEVYQWFKELSSFNRIDFLCSLMQLCLPNELRFIGTLLDDMNNKDYASLREVEDRSNSPNEFIKYRAIPINEEVVRKLCLSLSLLKSTNQEVGQIIYEILLIHSESLQQRVSSKTEFSTEVLLLYVLASYHPAFIFENRFKIGQFFKSILAIYRGSSDTSNKNNSCCYKEYSDIEALKIRVDNVTVNNSDADIILEINTNLNDCDYLRKRIAKFSKISELFNNNFKSVELMKLNSEISILKKNGNFNQKNICQVIEKICVFISATNGNENELKILRKFFLQLPEYSQIKSHVNCENEIPCAEKSVYNKEESNNNNNSNINNELHSKWIIQNDMFDSKSFEDQTIETVSTCSVNENHPSLELHKSFISTNNDFSKENVCASDIVSERNTQYGSEVGPNSDINGTNHEIVDSVQNECLHNTTFPNGTNYQDLNPIQMRFIFPVYSTPKSNSPLTQMPVIFYNQIDHVSNTGHSNTGKIHRPLIVPTYSHFTFNPHVSSIVPVINTSNQQPLTFNPLSEMNIELFQSRLYSVTNNVLPSSTVNKLSSSTPPRLQSNYSKPTSNT